MLILDDNGHVVEIVDDTIDELKRKPYGHQTEQIIEENNIEELIGSEEIESSTSQAIKEEFIKSELNDKNAFIEASVAFMDFLAIFAEVENNQLLNNEINKIKEFLHISVENRNPSQFME